MITWTDQLREQKYRQTVSAHEYHMSHSLDMRDKQLTHIFILKGVLKDPYIQAEETDIQRLLHLYRRHAMKAHILPPTPPTYLFDQKIPRVRGTE